MNTELALQLLLALLERSADIAALIQRAKAEGRDISDAELDLLAYKDKEARDALDDAIAKARTAGEPARGGVLGDGLTRLVGE